MADPEIATVARNWRRRWRLLDFLVFGGLAAASVAASLLVDVPVVPLALTPIVFYTPSFLALKVPLVVVDARERLVTGKSPEEVRREFAGADTPAYALVRETADAVERHDRGATFVVSRLWRTARSEYATELRPDGRVETSLRVGSRTRIDQTIDVVDAGDRTEVAIRTRTGRIDLLRAVLLWRGSARPRDRAYRIQGYDPAGRRSRISLWRR